jgi:hypothetical protein
LPPACGWFRPRLPSPGPDCKSHLLGLPDHRCVASVSERAKAGDKSLKVPNPAPRRRLDETLAARKPVLVYQNAPQAAAAE